MVESTESPVSVENQPKSVRHAVNLLRLQATIWALVSGDAWLNLKVGLTSPNNAAVVGTIAIGVAAAAFAAAKLWLAYRLPRSTHQTCSIVIGVEFVMAGFAGLVLVIMIISVFGVILSPPFIIGGIMSLRVARGLTKPPAQQYFDANRAPGDQSSALPFPEGGAPAQFRSYLAMA
jgi:hypothetical protein